MYDGLLPFRTMKGDDGVPAVNPETYHGLLLAFQLAAEVLSDRVVAAALNAAGYRPTGNSGTNSFTNDSV
jgi:hypothetical protein